jgi:hypothetical protein
VPQAIAPNVAVTVFVTPGQPDHLGIAYDGKVGKAEATADARGLARALGAPAPEVKVRTDGGIVSAEAKLPGLTNTSTGEVRLAAVLEAFRRYDRLRVTLFFLAGPPAVPLQAPAVPGYTIEKRAEGATVDFLIVRGVPPAAAAAAVERQEAGQRRWMLLALVAFIALVVAAVVFVIVRVRAS